jgi:hypothetical protein
VRGDVLAALGRNAQAFRAAVRRYADGNQIPWVVFRKGDRKLEVIRPYLDAAEKTGQSKVVAIGEAREFQWVFDATKKAGHLRLFRHGVNAGLSAVRRMPGAKSKQPPALHLLECLKHREADVLRFLTDTAIPPTSNQAERDLRPAKTQ